jgi:hypothetical protein
MEIYFEVSVNFKCRNEWINGGMHKMGSKLHGLRIIYRTIYYRKENCKMFYISLENVQFKFYDLSVLIVIHPCMFRISKKN